MTCGKTISHRSIFREKFNFSQFLEVWLKSTRTCTRLSLSTISALIHCSVNVNRTLVTFSSAGTYESWWRRCSFLLELLSQCSSCNTEACSDRETRGQIESNRKPWLGTIGPCPPFPTSCKHCS